MTTEHPITPPPKLMSQDELILASQNKEILNAVTEALYSLPAKHVPNEAARIAEIASIVLREAANQVRKEQYIYAASALSNISEISKSIENHANQKL